MVYNDLKKNQENLKEHQKTLQQSYCFKEPGTVERLWGHLKNYIPVDQAACQPGRGTTQQDFAKKLLAEKAITNSDYIVYLLILDMSKAFNTVSRKMLFEKLDKTLERDKLEVLSILTN